MNILALLFLLFFVGPAEAFNFAVGVYSGNATDNTDITVSPSFAIDALLVKCNTTQTAIFRTSAMSGDASDSLASGQSGGTFLTNRIQSLGTGTFQIGSAAEVNTSGTDNCFYVAWGKDSNNDMAVEVDDADDLSYLGDGTDNRDLILKPAFQPGIVILTQERDDSNPWRVTANTGDQYMQFTNTSHSVNCIQAFNSDGFEVGTATRCNDATGGTIDYFPFAVKDIAGYVTSGSYVSNTATCADDCSVTVGFQPNLVIIKGAGARDPYFRTSAMSGDFSCDFLAVACGADRLQSFTSTGFTHGSSSHVNTNGETYHWFAIKTPVYSKPSSRPIIVQ